jgi:hypothetical protein
LKQEDDKKLCESRDCWWPTIKRIAEQYEASLNKKGNKDSVFIQFNAERLNSALEMYERGWWNFKEHVYGKTAKEERIDRHKIIALYILAFLIKKPFSVSINPENKDINKRPFLLANELFSLVVMQELIFAWNEKNERFRMEENEKKWFIILLNYFNFKLTDQNKPFISEKPSDMVDFLSLAQIVYYIEKSYTDN